MRRFPALPLVAVFLCALAPAAAEDAIPFDAKKAKAVADRDRAWLGDATRAAYRSVGRRSPKWDADVEMAFRAELDLTYGPFWDRPLAEARLRAALQSAADAGCDDPLVGYLRARSAPRRRGDDEADRSEVDLVAAATALGVSEYPAVWKARAYLDALAALPAEPRTGGKQFDAFLGGLVKALAGLAKDNGPAARRELVELCGRAEMAWARVGRRKTWLDRGQADVLAGLPKDDPAPEACAGAFWLRYAFDGRGPGLASQVSPGAWRLFRERLTEAEKRLTAAWDRDHECEPAAAAMVGVCMGLGKDRETMETWFRRAVAADPTRTGAFDRKFEYLLPKWLGSEDELIAFGRQAARAGAWDTSLPLVLLRAYKDLAPVSSGLKREHYFGRPQVWADIGPVLEELRTRHPKSPSAASVYLYFAWQCDRNAAEALEFVRAQTLPLRLVLFPGPVHVDMARDWAKAKGDGKD
jgi:hypothetical protein